MKIKVLVTGANGQLAKTLKHLFLNTNDQIEFYFFNRKELDITSQDALLQSFNKNKYQYCINCAAYTNVELAETEKEKAFLVNAIAVDSVSKICKIYNTILIHISTDYVFDGAKSSPYTEDDITNPINEYGKSKLQGELNIKKNLEHYYIIRASWLYSAYGHNFLKTIVNKIKDNANLSVTTAQIGTPTSCEDLSRFIYYILNTKIAFGVYHFSAKGEATWFDFAREISLSFKSYNQQKLNAVENYKTNAKRPNYTVLNIGKTEANYQQLKHWKTSLKSLISLLG